MTAVMLVVLLGLGAWQLHRAEWKKNLIAERIERLAMPQFDTGAGPLDEAALSYRWTRLSLAGAHYESLSLFERNEAGETGYQEYLLVMQEGRVPFLMKSPRFFTMASGVPPRMPLERLDDAQGQIREGLFVPVDGPFRRRVAEQNTFLSQSYMPLLFLPVNEKGDGRREALHKKYRDIPNNHIGYAITWFSLALILIIIYLLAINTNKNKDD